MLLHQYSNQVMQKSPQFKNENYESIKTRSIFGYFECCLNVHPNIHSL